MKAIALGYGRSGKAAETLLCRFGYSVTALEGEAELPEGDFALAVVSPGIALTHRWMVEARRRGIRIKSELQLGCEELKRRGWKLVAITGSKGKSSVVKLIAEALRGIPCGNYGRPVCDLIDEKPGWAVVEVSSFQMETTELAADTFEAAAILNLQEDHLDRHGSRETYHALKRKLLTFAKAGYCCERANDSDVRLMAGSYFDNEVLRDNGAAAVRILRAVGTGDAEITQAFREFHALAHRMETVGVFDGVKYIDDSKATSIAALSAGVKMCGNSVRLIAGGLPKGDDPAEAIAELKRKAKKVYLIGQSAAEFHRAWHGAVECEICGTLEKAVGRAMTEASAGDEVLLSPGTASFDQFKSFGERGDRFAEYVKTHAKQGVTK